MDYTSFKNNLWDIKIKKSNPERELCFLKTVFERANKGQFFITPSCDSNILDNLLKDGILGYEEAGYFITHDVYEEWALEKTINIEFIKKINNEEFFNKIGHSLPIRRCFRNWLSEKLLLEDIDINQFIEEVVDNNSIQKFWKDEILVSVLLSDYSEIFFDKFEEELLFNNQELLKRLTFLLRIACKEINENFFKQLGIKELDLFKLEYVLTKPKGQGWESLIEFTYKNIMKIGLSNLNFILPIINDWNSHVKVGKTTRYASLIALQYYEWIIEGKSYFLNDNEEGVLKTIIHGAVEIETELKNIFIKILENKWKHHRDPYYELSMTILKEIDGISVCTVLPEYVLKLADLFWTYTPKRESPFGNSSTDIESYFGLEKYHSDYFPSSAFQTPIYWLLKTSFKETIDFILYFTNKSIGKYVDSGFDNFIQVVEVCINDTDIKKQYISNCLWNMYRGTGSPNSPYLLQSIHMALEKHLLELGERSDSKNLESILLYLIKNSKSASITSIITSVVLAYPEKTFNIAKIIFKTKEFIIEDTTRLVHERSAKSLYSMGMNMGITNNKFYEDERMKTCEEKHRKFTLESLFLQYQCFRSEEVTEQEGDKRQKELWRILDDYYQELEDKSDRLEFDKTWELFLARMDRRKMSITTELIKNRIEIKFNPEINSDLKDYSENKMKRISESQKYLALKLWAELKFKHDDEYKKYDKYEKDHLQALKEVKDIINKIEELESDKINQINQEGFLLFNKSIPAYVCSVLLDNNIEDLLKDDREFCKDILLEYGVNSINPNYQYQIFDGVEPTIDSMPILLKIFPEEKEKIKIILLLSLFNECQVGGIFEHTSFSIIPINAIVKMWDEYFDDAQSLLWGYLILKPKYNKLYEEIREANRQNGIFELDKNKVMSIFFEENEENIENMIHNKLVFNNKNEIDQIDLRILKTAFQMIPLQTENEKNKKIVLRIISIFSNTIVKENLDDKIDYIVKYEFFRQYAFFVLNSNKDDILKYLQPFVDNFGNYEAIADMFKAFILAEDSLNTYEEFWLVWNIFRPKVIEICKDKKERRDIDNIIESYLFAQTIWKKEAKSWHSFKDTNRRFFYKISNEIGYYPSTLYAISKLLNNIGSSYIDYGIKWISDILSNNDYSNKKLKTNTIYYIENLTRKFIFKNREKIKTQNELRDKLLVILNFLIDRGSSIGYMLRDNII